MENTFKKEWWVENLDLNDDNNVVINTVRYFKLEYFEEGFGLSFKTKNNKASINLINRINEWIKNEFPYTNVRVSLEKTFYTINFRKIKQPLNINLKPNINEGLNINLLKEFIKFTATYLKISKPQGIISLSKDTNKAREMGSMASFTPDNNNIWTYTENRNMADICRSIAHELVHFKQQEDGKEMNGETGSDIENEANALAGKIMREFGQKNPLIYEGLTDHAQSELQKAGLFDKNSDYDGMIGEAVLELIQTMSNQGHSGMSAQWVKELFNKLSNWENLTPLSSNPDEWEDASSYGGDKPNTMWQNKRNPAVFSYDMGKTWVNIKDDKENIPEHKQILKEDNKIYGDYLFGDKKSGVKIRWYNNEKEKDTKAELELFNKIKKYTDSERDIYLNIDLNKYIEIFDILRKEYPEIADPGISPNDYIYRGTSLNKIEYENLGDMDIEYNQGVIFYDKTYSSKRKLSSWSINYHNAATFAMSTAEINNEIPVVMRALVKNADLYFNPKFMNKLSNQFEEETFNSKNPINVDVMVIHDHKDEFEGF